MESRISQTSCRLEKQSSLEIRELAVNGPSVRYRNGSVVVIVLFATGYDNGDIPFRRNVIVIVVDMYRQIVGVPKRGEIRNANCFELLWQERIDVDRSCPEIWLNT